MKNTICIAATALVLGACATKSYQVAAPLSSDRARGMSCRELSFEMAEITETEVAIKKEAKTDIRSVGAFMMDFGIGNSMAKGRAEKALAERKASVVTAMTNKGCNYSGGGVNQ